MGNMKRLAIAVVIGFIAVCLLGTASITVLADDPITVDVVVLGDDPTVTVGVDGEGATVYINGQDIQQPTVYEYRIENSYNDAALKEDIGNLEALLEEAGMDLIVTSDGLAKVILVIGEHTKNLRELLDIVRQDAKDSVGRDSELVKRVENYEVFTSDSLSDMDADYHTTFVNMDTRIDELSSDFNEKLVWTWGGFGAFGLLLLVVWRLWQVRLRQG